MDLWNDTVRKVPEKPGAVWEDRAYSYLEMDRSIRRLSGRLKETMGVGPGDKVALLMPNCIEFVIAYLSIVRIGAVALPVNIRLKPPEIRFILGDAQVSALLVHEKTWRTAKASWEDWDALKGVVGVGVKDERVTPYEKLVSEEVTVNEKDFPRLQKDDVAVIIYTSGTTGLPKGAMLTHDNLLFNAASCIAGFGFHHEDIHLVVVPLFHVTGLNTILITSIQVGSTLVISDKPNPRDILEKIQKHEVTTFFGVPTTYVLFLATQGIEAYGLFSARLFVYSGAPMAPETIFKLREMFPAIELVNLYGLTETTSITTVLPAEDAVQRIESVGKAVPNLELQVVDEEDRVLGPREVGELCVRARSVFKGYFNRPQATEEAFLGDWFRTGDHACLDEEGYLYLKGRKKEMIIVGGENVYPIEVENVLCSHPQVLEAAVYGVQHKVWGEWVKAAVVPRPGEQITEEALKKHCSDRLASFKVPRRISFMETLPRNPSGKVVKRELD